MANVLVTQMPNQTAGLAAIYSNMHLNPQDCILEWASKTTIKIKGSNYIPLHLNSKWWIINTDTIISTAAAMDVGAISNGNDYYVYACDNNNTLEFLISLSSTFPNGYNANTSRKLGGFHTLCVNVGAIGGHILTGYTANDILPQSVWDLKNRPRSEPEGMVKSPNGIWVDIYLPSVSGTELVSVNGGTIADSISATKFHAAKFEQWFARIKKRALCYAEFVDASIGANQGTNIAGSADPGTTSGHSDTIGRRMISNIGCEDMCGIQHQWGNDYGPVSTSTIGYSNAYDGNDSGVGGQMHYANSRTGLGGSWNDGVACGSRHFWSTQTQLYLSASGYYSARGCSEAL